MAERWLLINKHTERGETKVSFKCSKSFELLGDGKARTKERKKRKEEEVHL